jgi:hypothetical protein
MMIDSSLDESLYVEDDNNHRHNDNSNNSNNKKKKPVTNQVSSSSSAAPRTPPPKTIAVPRRSSQPKRNAKNDASNTPFDEVDRKNYNDNKESESLLSTSTHRVYDDDHSRVPSDEEDPEVNMNGSNTTTAMMTMGSPTKTISAATMMKTPVSVYYDKEVQKPTTPETQPDDDDDDDDDDDEDVDLESPNKSYIEEEDDGDDDDTVECQNTSKCLDYLEDPYNSKKNLLSSSSYQKPIPGNESCDADERGSRSANGDESKLSSTTRNNTRRTKKWLCCTVLSCVLVAAAAGVLTYFFVFNDGTVGRFREKAVTTSPTVSPVPSFSPSLSAVPSDVPSFSPTQTPSATPSDVPSSSPSDAPSSSPTLSPTREFVTELTEFLFGTYGVIFDENDVASPANMAVAWLNQEAQENVNGGTLDLNPAVAQRFALLSLEFGVLQNDEALTDEAEDVLFQDSNNDNNTTNTTNNDEGGFFGVRQQVPPPLSTFANTAATFFVNECNWTGVECSEDGVVTKVRWGYRTLTGTVPPEIRLLSNVTHLDLSNNELQGKIPEELYDLTNLERLYLFKNFFTGTLSTRIGHLDKITHFHLSHNELSGTLPIEMKSDSGSVNGIRPLSKLYCVLHFRFFFVIGQ